MRPQRKTMPSGLMMALGGMLKEKETPSYGEGGAMKYRSGGMIYGEQSAAVTLPDESAEKEKKFVQSNYGSGENRITEADIRMNRSLNPYEEYGGYTIKGDQYGKTRQAVGFHPKRMTDPGYFLVQGYTDEQQMKNVEAGRPDATQQYLMVVLPDGGRRAIPLSQVMDEFTTGAEGEQLIDILEAMDTGATRTETGFSLPSRDEQIRTIMNRRANYGLDDITINELKKELGLEDPKYKKGEYAEKLDAVLKDRAAGNR